MDRVRQAQQDSTSTFPPAQQDSTRARLSGLDHGPECTAGLTRARLNRQEQQDSITGLFRSAEPGGNLSWYQVQTAASRGTR